MPKESIKKRELLEKAFAKAYVENGFNGTQAVMAVRPDLPPESASVASSRWLRNDSVQLQIQGFSQDVLNLFSQTLTKAIALADRWVSSPEEDQQDKGMTWIKDLAKSLAPTAKPAPKHQHLHIPK